MTKEIPGLQYCPNCGNKETFDDAAQYCPDCDITFKTERGAVRPAKQSRIDKIEERLARAEERVKKVTRSVFDDDDDDEVF